MSKKGKDAPALKNTLPTVKHAGDSMTYWVEFS